MNAIRLNLFIKEIYFLEYIKRLSEEQRYFYLYRDMINYFNS